MVTVTLNSGKSFNTDQTVSILDAARSAGVSFPYSCQTGQCQTCRCKLLAGETDLLRGELGLSDSDKADGWILSCCRTALTDLSLEVDDLSRFDLPKPRTLPARIDSLEMLTPDVVRVTLRMPPRSGFRFFAGQYVEVIGPRGVRRSYSIAGFDESRQLVELHIKQVNDGVMSRYWFSDANVNDLVRLKGPLGTFFLRDYDGMDLIFLATGTGIAPVKAMLDFLTRDEVGLSRPQSVTVIWGGRTDIDLYLDFSELLVGYTYIPVVSRACSGWVGETGYIQRVLLSRISDFSNAAVYACGSANMIDSSRKSLIEAGLEATRFYSDAFVSSGQQ